MKILVLFAHPAFHKSKVNKLIVEGLQGMQNVTFHDLYDAYPESYIDIKREQKLLSAHDAIVFHFPLFWYSTPSILKEWQDMVLEHGWAFGSKGDALKDKLFFCIITAGGPQVTYQEGQFHNHTINQLLSPIRQTAVLCKMIPLPPFIVFGSHDFQNIKVKQQTEKLLELIDNMGRGIFNLEDAKKQEFLNDYITIQQINNGR